MRPSLRFFRMIRMVILSALAPATAVALWQAPGALWAWVLLAGLIGFTAGTINWLRWARRLSDDAAEAGTTARRRRLARLTGRADLYRDEGE